MQSGRHLELSSGAVEWRAVGWCPAGERRNGFSNTAADQVRGFCEGLERSGDYQDWQVRQAEQALRIYLAREVVSDH